MAVTRGINIGRTTILKQAARGDGNNMSGLLAWWGVVASGGELKNLYTAGIFKVNPNWAVLKVGPLVATVRPLRAAWRPHQRSAREAAERTALGAEVDRAVGRLTVQLPQSSGRPGCSLLG